MKLTHAIAVGALAAVSGCSMKTETVTPEVRASMLEDLRLGRLTLDCGDKCSLTWVAEAPTIHALDIAEKWDDLAVRVMQIGFGSDLAYYYLGQSAQGLGYYEASISYYRYALTLATGQDTLHPFVRCEAGQSAGSDPCQGVDLAGTIPVLIEASQNAMAQQEHQAGRVSAGRPRHSRPPAASASSSGQGTGWVAPPPTTSAATGNSASGGSGWVAPPAPSQ